MQISRCTASVIVTLEKARGEFASGDEDVWVFRSRAQRESRVHLSAAPLSSTLRQPASENTKKAVLLLAVGGKACAKIKKNQQTQQKTLLWTFSQLSSCLMSQILLEQKNRKGDAVMERVPARSGGG